MLAKLQLMLVIWLTYIEIYIFLLKYVEHSAGFIFTILSCLIKFLHSVITSCVRILHIQVVRVFSQPATSDVKTPQLALLSRYRFCVRRFPKAEVSLGQLPSRGLAVATSDTGSSPSLYGMPLTVLRDIRRVCSPVLSRPGLYYDITQRV